MRMVAQKLCQLMNAFAEVVMVRFCPLGPEVANVAVPCVTVPPTGLAAACHKCIPPAAIANKALRPKRLALKRILREVATTPAPRKQPPDLIVISKNVPDYLIKLNREMLIRCNN
jgi:hypothetical protein